MTPASTSPGQRVPLDGTFNTRDIGGWPVAGGHVATGRVYRSDNLHGLSDADVDTLDRLGIKLALDLRAEVDVETYADRLPARTRHRSIPIRDNPGTVPLGQQLREGKLREFTDEMMVTLYDEIISNWAPAFGEVVTAIAEPGNLPLVVHCVAGKDRTGISAALVLLALGVDRATVLAEHGRSTEYWGTRQAERLRPVLEEHDITIDAVRPLVESRPEVLDGAIRDLEARWGSVEAYLTGPCGCPADIVDRLRTALVVDDRDALDR